MKLEQVEVGQIVNTHGVRGEMKVQPWCDTPEQFLTFPTLYLDGTPVKTRTMLPYRLIPRDSVRFREDSSFLRS